MILTEILTRKELYDLVWKTPLLTLSKKYNLSDNGLRKICIRMQIPLPVAGHWMRLKFNKNVTPPALTDNYAGEETITLPLRSEGKPLIPADPVKVMAVSLLKDAAISFEVPERLNTKNPLILAAKERLTGKHRFEKAGVVGCHRGELDIKVGIDNIARVLRFADTLLNILAKRGHGIAVDSMDTFAVINGQRLKILFRERLKKRIVKGEYYDSTELHPTGILVFRVDGFYGKEWNDGKEKLENNLPEIVAFLETESLARKQRAEERKKESLEWERKDQLRKELQARKEQDLSEFAIMLQKAERWNKAINLRNYISEVDRKGIATSEWLTWARQKADWYDPFIEANDELFEDIDRNTLQPARNKDSHF